MEITKQFERITGKISLKSKELQSLRKQNEHFQHQIDKLNQKQTELTIQLENLKQENAVLKAATGNMNAEDKKNLEQTINKYLRDIDKCITLLAE